MSTFPSFEGQLNSTLIDSQRNPSLTTPAGSSKPPRRRQKSKPGASSEVVPAVVQASRAGSSKSGGNQGGGELRKKHSTEIGRSSGLSRGRGFSTTAGQIPRIKTADSSLLTPSNSTRNMSDFARRSADLPPPDSSLSIPWNAPETLDDVKVEAKVEPSARKRKTKSKKSKTKTEGEDGKDEDLAPSSADDSGPLLSQIVGETSAQSGAQPTVEEQILRLYESQKALPNALRAREVLIERLERLLNKQRFQWGQYHSAAVNPIRVEAFGSVRFGLSTSTSDLDLCLLDPYHPEGWPRKHFRNGDPANSPPLPGIYDMRCVARTLMQTHHRFGLELRNIVPIPFSGVPIVKFEAHLDGEVIQVDLNTNERFGVLNSSLIAAYTKVNPLVKPLCVFVKFYFRQRQLNDPSGARGPVTFSSYTLILLVIAYLQHLNLVPNLQSDEIVQSARVPRRKFWSRPRQNIRRKTVHVSASTGWDTTYAERIPKDFQWTPAVIPGGVAELALGFFNYYGRFFEPENEVVAIASGGSFRRARPIRSFTEAAHGKKKTQLAPSEKDATALEETLGADRRNEGNGGDENEAEEDPEVTRASRSSSPVAYGRFSEPYDWQDQNIVVQDPFILTRNTARNVGVDIATIFRQEMQRAACLLEEGASLDVVCASKKHEAGYKSLAELRRVERNKRMKLAAAEKERLQKEVKKTPSTSSDFAGSSTESKKGASNLKTKSDESDLDKLVVSVETLGSA